MSTPDLQPTQRLPIPPPPAGAADFGNPPDLAQAPRDGVLRTLAGLLGRVALLVALAVAALLAVGLLLTPTRESVLILGSDARPDEIADGQVGRTDTLLLLVADRAMPKLAMVSVPRDLWVTIPGHGQERVNAAYELGGGATAKQTVSNVLAQRVDRVAVIGLQGVRDVVDAVGGVDITVAQAIHDDTYPTDNYGYQTVDIPAGRQHMDGDTALKYARTRHQDSDFGRIARQQQVIGAVRNALLNPLNWPRIPAVAAAVARSIKTDVSPLDAVAVTAAALRAGEPEHLVIDTSLVNPITGEDGAYLLEPKPSLQPSIARFLLSSGNGPPPSVEILNGVGVAGLAARTADRLTQQGFVVANVGDAPRSVSQTTIAARPSATQAAQQVANLLGVPVGRVTQNAALSGADIQVILGPDAH